VVGRVALPPGTPPTPKTTKAKNKHKKRKNKKKKQKEKKELNVVLPYNMYCSYGCKVSGYLPQHLVVGGLIMLG